METPPLQVTYRAIFTEMLLAQTAALGACVGVASRCAQLAGQEYQAALATMARSVPTKDGAAEPARPGGGGPASPRAANVGRALAGLPRISMMVFLSQYDNLRSRRRAVRD